MMTEEELDHLSVEDFVARHGAETFKEIFTAKFLVELYKHMKLEGVDTDYEGRIDRQGDMVWGRPGCQGYRVENALYMVATHFGAYKQGAIDCAKKILKTMIDHKKYPTHFAAQVCNYTINTHPRGGDIFEGQLVWGYK